MVNLSAVIICFNEEQNIGRCIESLKKVADEIVVVDSYSTDKTKEICLKENVVFSEHKFEGHIEQKSYALTLASFDHILSLDADEALSDELAKEIIKIKSDWQADGYYLNRLSSYCGKWIRHCGWYPDKKLRLFDRRKGAWGGINPHDKYMLKNPENSLSIHADLLHYTYHTIKQHIEQVNYFTEIGATQGFANGKKGNMYSILVKPPYKFIRDYFFKAGFMDGYYGLVVCVISAYATFLKYVKIKELARNNKS